MVNDIGLTVQFNRNLEKSWKGQGIPSLLESENPLLGICYVILFDRIMKQFMTKYESTQGRFCCVKFYCVLNF